MHDWVRREPLTIHRQEVSVNLILTAYDEETRVLVNWSNVCYVELRGADGEDMHARLHFNVTAGTGAMSLDVVEDIDDIASMLETEGEAVIELEDEDEDEEGEE
jgi:hypothetical protein